MELVKRKKMLAVANLYDEVNMEISHHLNQALYAHALLNVMLIM